VRTAATERDTDADEIPQEPLRPIRSARRTARAPLTCATCAQEIAPGERYREDMWRTPIFGATLTSAICADCEADGL
jgi:hypothetical protein